MVGRGLTRVGLAGLALLVASCAAKKPPAPPPPTVEVSKPLLKQIVDWDDYVGQFVAVDSVDIRPRVTGYLQSVAFKDGQTIRQGALLFIIDPRPYQAALDQAKGQELHAEATLFNTKTVLARAKTLLAIKAIAQQEYDTDAANEKVAEADVVSEKATVATAALNLKFTRVTAPLTGRISDRRVAPGNLVTADTTVLTNIVNLDPIRFSFTGGEGNYLKYQRENAAGSRRSSRFLANPVEIKLQDEPTYRWKGRMEFVDNALDTTSGTIRGRAVLSNPNLFLTPGMFGHLRLLGSGAYQGMLIPDESVVTDQSRQVVYVVDPKGIVRQKLVQLGPLSEGLRVVRSGLDVNDLVVISGVQRAHPGKPATAQQGKITAPSPGTAPDPAQLTTPAAGSATSADQVR